MSDLYVHRDERRCQLTRRASRSDVLEWLAEHGEAEQVQWCEEHGYVVKDPQSTACLLKALSPATTGITDLAPCSIVPKLLVDV